MLDFSTATLDLVIISAPWLSHAFLAISYNACNAARAAAFVIGDVSRAVNLKNDQKRTFMFK